MSGERDEELCFVCPECEESLAVNEEMRNTLIRRGCVICGASVSEEAFTDGPFPDSS